MAKQQGIVEIKVHAPNETFHLEEALQRRFKLDEVVLAPGDAEETEEERTLRTTKLAADYLLQQFQSGERIGVSWGSTLAHWLSQMIYSRLEEVEVVPLVGGIGQFRFEWHANFIAQQLAHKLNAKCYQLYAPAIVERKEIRETLLSDKSIADVLQLAEQTDWAIVGIGDPYNSTMIKAGYLGEKELSQLKQAGAVADCCSQFVDADGKLCEVELNERVMALPLPKLKKHPCVVGICSGLNKVKALRAMLKGGYINILISDRTTAEQLLE